MYKVTSRWPHQDSVKIEWNLGKRCNLDCAYCPPEIHDMTSPHTDIDTLKNTVDILAEFDKPVRISFTGGEPTVHPHFEELVKHTKSKLSWVNITSNGLRKPVWYAEAPVDHYVFSLHFDNESWARALGNILWFNQQNTQKIPFHVNVMAHHDHMKRVKEATARLVGYSIPFALRRIRWTEKHDWFDDMRYDAQDLKWLLSINATAKPNCVVDEEELAHANDIIKTQRNQFEGWKCAAGVESLMINWDGEVHRATCRVGGSLGNIYNGSFTRPTEYIDCTRKFCTCAADIPLTKMKND
jgi:MoaA/NifB/PqqE/SkfB family radical SAM enzyme